MVPPRCSDKGKVVASATPSKRSRPSSGSSGEGFDGTLFRSLEAFQFYSSDIITRKVHLGKRIDFEFFVGAGYDLHGLFEPLGWVPYVSINEKVYPHLVNMFYANFVVDADKRISTILRKYKVSFTDEESKSLTGFDDIDGCTLARMRMSIQDSVFVRTGSHTPQTRQGPPDDDGDEFVLSIPRTSRPCAPVEALRTDVHFLKMQQDRNENFMQSIAKSQDVMLDNHQDLKKNLKGYKGVDLLSAACLAADAESTRPVKGVDPDQAQLFRVDPNILKESTTIQKMLLWHRINQLCIGELGIVLTSEELELEKFITHEISFSEINKAFELMLRGEGLRCLIRMDA
ncbi:hypothetical protein Taro_001237 [Colocasia esculenta]|uniref:Uncharacterized protein n=1 Tax=Colocasia esculenta TaxID=4460 RepID=A0A843TCZ4_COLES|nr:hypothetical protein [Colocasia esculenta]